MLSFHPNVLSPQDHFSSSMCLFAGLSLGRKPLQENFFSGGGGGHFLKVFFSNGAKMGHTRGFYFCFHNQLKTWVAYSHCNNVFGCHSTKRRNRKDVSYYSKSNKDCNVRAVVGGQGQYLS